jgi:hypothetical protein
VRVNPDYQGRSQPADLRFPERAGHALGSLSLSPSGCMLRLHRRPVRMRVVQLLGTVDPLLYSKNVNPYRRLLPDRPGPATLC